MKRLAAGLARPDFAPDAATLDELRLCSPFLEPEQVSTIVRSAVTATMYGHNRAGLLGAVLRGRSTEEAEAAAKEVDQVTTSATRGLPEEAADKEARSNVLMQALGSLGDAPYGVYEPFLHRLGTAGTYICKVPPQFTGSLSRMPQRARDEFCRIALSTDLSTVAHTYQDANAQQMFFALKFVSTPEQEAVFDKVKSVYDSTPSRQRMMAIQYMPGAASRDPVFEGIDSATREKWKGLFAS